MYKTEMFEPDEDLKSCCNLCESYCGDEHDFNECHHCPIFKLYQKYKNLSWHVSWLGAKDMGD